MDRVLLNLLCVWITAVTTFHKRKHVYSAKWVYSHWQLKDRSPVSEGQKRKRKEERNNERFMQYSSSALKNELMAQTFITLRLMHAGHRLPLQITVIVIACMHAHILCARACVCLRVCV